MVLSSTLFYFINCIIILIINFKTKHTNDTNLHSWYRHVIKSGRGKPFYGSKLSQERGFIQVEDKDLLDHLVVVHRNMGYILPTLPGLRAVV